MSADNINKLTIVLEGDSKRLQAALNAANNAMKGFDSKAKKIGSPSGGLGFFNNQLGKVGAAMAGVFAVDRLIDFGKEAIKLGAQIDGVSRAFNDMSITASLSLQSLRTSTMGAVSDIDLMQQAVQARNFKIPLEGLSELFEFAAIRAQQTGESVEYLTRSIVLGIGRKSPLILDNLGITLVRLKEAMGKVGRESATVEDIFKATVKIAKEETEITKILGDNALTAANKIDGLGAAFKNLKTSIGEAIVENEIFMAGIESLTETLETMGLKSAIKKAFGDADIKESIQDKLLEFGFISNDLDENLKRATIEQLREVYEAVEQARKEFRRRMGEEAIEFLGGEEAIEEAARSSEKMKASVDKLLESSPIEKYAKERARAFRDMVSERMKELSKEQQAVQEHEGKINSIYDKLNENLIRQMELYRQNGDAKAYIDGVSKEYSKTLVALRLAGEDGTASFESYDKILIALKETLSNLTAEEAYQASLEAIKQTTDDLTLSEQDLKRALEDTRKARLAAMDTNSIYSDEAGVLGWEGEEAEDADDFNLNDLNKQTGKHLQQLQRMATMWGVISQAIGGISDNLNEDNGFSKVIQVFSKLAQTAAATAAAVAAVRTALGDATAGAKTIAAAVGVATAMGGILGAAGIAGIGGGRNSGGYNVGSLSGQTLYTEISGRNLKIVLDRENGFSSRRGG